MIGVDEEVEGERDKELAWRGHIVWLDEAEQKKATQGDLKRIHVQKQNVIKHWKVPQWLRVLMLSMWTQCQHVAGLIVIAL